MAVPGLPASYVAVSRAFTAALPDDDDNRRLLGELVEQVKSKHDAVVIEEVAAGGGDGLEQQARVLAQATAFFGGYGDLAVLAASCGVPVTAYHSEKVSEETVTRVRAAEPSGWGRFSLERARRFKGVKVATKEHA